MKPRIPDVIDYFRAYNKVHPAWGSLHIVLSDGNVEDSNVQFCLKYAEENKDEHGMELAKLLLNMSRTQRLKLGRMI